MYRLLNRKIAFLPIENKKELAMVYFDISQPTQMNIDFVIMEDISFMDRLKHSLSVLFKFKKEHVIHSININTDQAKGIHKEFDNFLALSKNQ